MAFNLGAVVAHIKADISDFQAGMNKVSSQTQGFTDTMKNVGSQAAIFTGALAAGFGLIGKKALDSASSFEQNRIAFETMLGGADEAKDLLQKISDFAIKTPFELSELVEGSKKLLAYNTSAEDIIPTMKMLGDITSGVGVEKMPQLILAFGQVKAATKLTGAELRQFSEAGVPLLQALADKAGVSAAEMIESISAGEVSFEQVQDALAGMTSEGGKFFDGMESQSKTFGGVVSNIKDQIGRIMRSVMGLDSSGDIKEGSIFARISDLAFKFLGFLDSATPTIVGTVDKIVDAIGKFIDSLQPLADWILNNQETVIAFMKGLAIGLGALLIIGTIAGLIALFTNPLFLIVTAITILYTAWSTNFLGIKDITQVVWDFISMVFNDLLMPLFTMFIEFLNATFFPAFDFVFNGLIVPMFTEFSQWFRDNWDSIKAYIQFVWDLISGIIKIAWSTVLGILQVGLYIMTGDFRAAFEAAKATVERNWDLIKGIFNSAIGFIKGWGGQLVDKLVQPFSDAWNKIKEYVDKIKDALDFTKRHSPSVVDIVKSGVQKVNNALDGLNVSANVDHLAPNIQPVGAGISRAGQSMSINLDLKGAIISSDREAQRFSKMVGNNIVKSLQANVRF